MVDPADGRPQPFPSNAPTILIAILIPVFIAILIAILFPSSLWGIPGSYTSFWFPQLILIPGGPERLQASKCFKRFPSNGSWSL